MTRAGSGVGAWVSDRRPTPDRWATRPVEIGLLSLRRASGEKWWQTDRVRVRAAAATLSIKSISVLADKVVW